MYTTPEELLLAGRMALEMPELLAMMTEWNNSSNWEEQDMLLCKVMHFVKEKLVEGYTFKDEFIDEDIVDISVLDINVIDSRDDDCYDCDCVNGPNDECGGCSCGE